MALCARQRRHQCACCSCHYVACGCAVARQMSSEAKPIAHAPTTARGPGSGIAQGRACAQPQQNRHQRTSNTQTTHTDQRSAHAHRHAHTDTLEHSRVRTHAPHNTRSQVSLLARIAATPYEPAAHRQLTDTAATHRQPCRDKRIRRPGPSALATPSPHLTPPAPPLSP